MKSIVSLVPLLCVAGLVVGCGSISVDADGVSGFQPSAQVWLVESSTGANRHSFALTTVAGYCSKKQNAEADRIAADQRHQERLADGDPVCESDDLRMDDLADAYAPLQGKGVSYLYVVIDREDETALDARTAPEAGEYRQVGAGGLGSFTAQLVRYDGKPDRERAEAYTCLSPDEVDAENYQEYLAEEEPDLVEAWNLDAGILSVEESGDSAWSIDVDGDLLSGSSTIGSLEASFVGKRCEVEVTGDLLD